MRVALISGNQLCNNPRLVKEADALTSAGYQVVVYGGKFTEEGSVRDLAIALGKAWEYRMAYDLTKRNLTASWIKLKKKIGSWSFQAMGLENRWQLGYGARELLRQVLAQQPDLVISHSEMALVVCEVLLKKGVPVGVDMEDWFSEDLLPEAQKQRPNKLLKKLESLMLGKGVWSTCPSGVMADALVKAYGCRRPLVIRNVFPAKDREQLDGKWKDRPGMTKWMERNDPTVERPKDAPVSIHWFSQTIGPGRGLEELFLALEGMTGNWELHLRGNLRGYETWLRNSCPSKVWEKTKIHEQVSNEELPSRIAEHDIGYAGENIRPESRNLTITNKFFQYLQAGLAVVASETEGQQEGANLAKGGVLLFPTEHPESLRGILKKLIHGHGYLAGARRQALAAGQELSWEREAKQFLGLTADKKQLKNS